MAQQSDAITLREAVYGDYGQLRPHNLVRFTWLPNGKGYCYLEGQGDATRLVIRDPDNLGSREITLSELNRGVQSQGFLSMRFFPAISWMNENQIAFDYFQKIFVYDIPTGQTEFLMNYVENAQNAEFNHRHKALSYFSGPNVFVQYGDTLVNWVTRHPAGPIKAGQALHRFEFGNVKGTFWSTHGDLLAFFQSDESNIAETRLRDYGTGDTEGRAIRYPMAGRNGEMPSVGVYNLSSQETYYLETGELRELYFSHLTWSPNDRYIYLNELSRDQKKLELAKYEATSGRKVGVLITETDEKYVTPHSGPIFIPDGSGDFLWVSSRDGYKQLFRYNAEGKLVKKLFSEEFDIHEIVGFDEKAGHAWLTIHKPVLQRNIYRLNLRNGKLQSISENAWVHQSEVSPDRSRVWFQWSNPETPGKDELFSTDGKKIRNLSEASNPISGKEMPDMEVLSLRTEDGTDLYGCLMKPAQVPAGEKLPVLVFVHGAPQTQMVQYAWNYGAPLWLNHVASEGYVVFMLDNRGTGNRGKAFEQALYGKIGSVEVDDQLLGVNYLSTLNYVDVERMAVHGWSYGGYLAAALMLRAPGVFKAGVAGGTVTGWKDYESMYAERYLGSPSQNPDAYKMSDLLTYATNLQDALLLLHGGSDEVVLPDQPARLVRALVSHDKHIDHFVYPGHPHNIHGKDRLHLMERILHYIQLHLNKSAEDDSRE